MRLGCGMLVMAGIRCVKLWEWGTECEEFNPDGSSISIFPKIEHSNAFEVK